MAIRTNLQLSTSALLLLAALLMGPGCARVHMPAGGGPAGGAPLGLVDHVEFLTQPALNGRKCHSTGSRYARRYIEDRFEGYGLKPWPGESGYDQSFGFGTNVIGVLPGSDPAVADQVVLVCAHYDSLGVKDGKVYPGAADDAGGVAVMLEAARRMAALTPAPRRPVAFAAFDCGQRRFLGAFAFTLRDDFDPGNLAAVIDLDLLGRPNLGIMDDTLIAVGTEHDPQLRQAVYAAGRASGLRILPAGIDLVPPLGDYFAFEQYPAATILLTTGLYFDYHKPTDTPDKLDFRLLNRSVDVAVATIEHLANRDAAPAAQPATAADREELQAILTTLEEVLAAREAFDLTPGEVANLTWLADRARTLLAGETYTPVDRRRFIGLLAQKAARSVVRFLYERPKPPPEEIIPLQRLRALLVLHEFLGVHRAFVSRATQQVMQHFLAGRYNLFRLLSSHTFTGCEILPAEIVFEPQDGDDYRLSFVYPRLTIKAGLFGRDLDVVYTAADARGTPGELVDYSLLYWSQDDAECMAEVMPAVLARLTGRPAAGDYRDWLAWRLDQLGLASEDAWQRGLRDTDNPSLLKLLLTGPDDEDRPGPARLREIIADRTMRPDVRLEAIGRVPADPDRATLQVLTGALDDHTPVAPSLPPFDPTYPLGHYTAVRMMRYEPPQVPPTVSAAAHASLIDLTGQYLPPDPAAWREWIEDNAAGE